MSDPGKSDTNWKRIYRLGGGAALGAVLIALIEISITFLPGGNASPETVLDWFMLFKENWFMGLRNLGLLNILLNACAIPIFLALYGAHRRVNQPYAALAMVVSFIGLAVFYATNRAFPMLELSNQYAAATTESQRAMLIAAGQALLSVGQSHTPGTFLGFFLAEVAGVMISVVMLQGKVFSKVNAIAGILGFAILLIFEFLSAFVPALADVTMQIAMAGGLMSMAWYILIAHRLFRLSALNE